MTPEPVTVHPKDPIATAIRRMEEGGYRHLPVVVDGKAVGVLSVKRVVHYLVEHFPAMVYNLPPKTQSILPRAKEPNSLRGLHGLRQEADRPEKHCSRVESAMN